MEFVREGAGHVRQLWEVLQLETERRSVLLEAALQAQQYYSEAAKVESWLSGQKLNLASEEKGTVCTPVIVTLLFTAIGYHQSDHGVLFFRMRRARYNF